MSNDELILKLTNERDLVIKAAECAQRDLTILRQTIALLRVAGHLKEERFQQALALATHTQPEKQA